jgi:hypothetical protein
VNAVGVDGLLRVFRRNLTVIQLLRAAWLGVFVLGLLWAAVTPGGVSRPALLFVAMAVVAAWLSIVSRSVWLLREVQASNWLMAYGRLDDAEVRLGRTLAKFSLSARGQFMLLQQLAGLLFRRDRYAEVVAICKELLRPRVAQFRGHLFNTRVLLADSLLLLDRVDEAYAAMRPVYNGSLTLAERMKLLPVQLRYELAAGHAAAAVGGMADKVKVAELMDSPRAGLVHALLAEACRRQALPVQESYLAERARLYCDLGLLAERYPVIKGIAAVAADGSGSATEN